MGNVDDYKVGARVLNQRGKFFLLRTADGFKALYQVCTHLGCLDREMDDGYACPCHGSFFSPDGKTITGGRPGTAAPAWGALLSTQEIEDAIAFPRSRQ